MKAKSSISLGSRIVGESEPCFVIAEIGINHNGSLDIAKKLIDAAVDAGADAVKFQKRSISVVYSEEELARPREVPAEVIKAALERGVLPPENVERLKNNPEDTTNGDLKWALEFNEKEYAEIDTYCRDNKIMWIASPWDEASVEFLAKFDVPAYKIASASLTDAGLLDAIRSTKKPIILSTGMSTMEEIEAAVKVLGEDDLILMQCVATYPAELDELNLSAISALREHFSLPIGYSGHEKGVYMSLCAAVLGAVAVERHLTLDRSMWGSDQSASLEPKGLGLLINEIRNFEKAKGDGIKKVIEREQPSLQKLRRKNTLTL
jgi:N-acetylneuraminate synthase